MKHLLYLILALLLVSCNKGRVVEVHNIDKACNVSIF